MSIKCRIWWDVQTESYVLSLVPDRNLKTVVQLLKTSIPSGDRDYDPKTNFWYMKEQYGEAVRGFVGAIYGIGSVAFTSRTVAEQAQRQQPLRSTATAPIKEIFSQFLQLVGSGDDKNGNAAITYEVAKRAYRNAAATFHPDKGNGDPEKMLKLNELWSRVQKEYYHK